MFEIVTAKDFYAMLLEDFDNFLPSLNPAGAPSIALLLPTTFTIGFGRSGSARIRLHATR